jgi:hypothetical protein
LADALAFDRHRARRRQAQRTDDGFGLGLGHGANPGIEGDDAGYDRGIDQAAAQHRHPGRGRQDRDRTAAQLLQQDRGGGDAQPAGAGAERSENALGRRGVPSRLGRGFATARRRLRHDLGKARGYRRKHYSRLEPDQDIAADRTPGHGAKSVTVGKQLFDALLEARVAAQTGNPQPRAAGHGVADRARFMPMRHGNDRKSVFA